MISIEESEAGLRAYEQVLAFASLRRRRLPLIYVIFPLIFVTMGVAALMQSMVAAAVACFVSGIFSAVFATWNWRRLGRRDVSNRALLAELHAKYGDDLPWLEVERQLATIEELKAEMAEGNRPPEESPR